MNPPVPDSLCEHPIHDDQRTAKTLKDIFIVKGYETEAADVGTEAIEKVTEGYFDCVLSDIKMPEMNGVELCKAIRGAA